MSKHTCLQTALTRLATVERERQEAVERLQHVKGGDSPAAAGAPGPLSAGADTSPALQAALERVMAEQQRALDAARVAEQHKQEAAAHERSAQVGVLLLLASKATAVAYPNLLAPGLVRACHCGTVQ